MNQITWSSTESRIGPLIRTILGPSHYTVIHVLESGTIKPRLYTGDYSRRNRRL